MVLLIMFEFLALGLLFSTGFYAVFLTILTIPFVQNQVIYLNKVTLTWGQDVNYPEQWGFLHNQVTPFNIRTSDGETLHAWHILPLQLYTEYQDELLKEPEGLAPDIKQRRSFQLLRDDPDSLLVIYLHGAAGTLGSGWRPPSYRAMSVAEPRRIHTVAIDYRGFGISTGSPSEEGLLTDAVSLARWAMDEAGIPPSRIVIFGQSIGTGASVALTHHMASLPEPILFSGMVLVAPFVDIKLLTATYRLAGTIPLLSPVAKFPALLDYLNTFIKTKFPNKDKIAELIRGCEERGIEGEGEEVDDAYRYRITIIHAEDDYDIPWMHGDTLFWHAVNASFPEGISQEDFDKEKEATKLQRGTAGGWTFERKAPRGLIKEEIMKYGLHDRIMSYPVVSQAIAGAFGDNL